jgi:hypothetical protein
LETIRGLAAIGIGIGCCAKTGVRRSPYEPVEPIAWRTGAQTSSVDRHKACGNLIWVWAKVFMTGSAYLWCLSLLMAAYGCLWLLGCSWLFMTRYFKFFTSRCQRTSTDNETSFSSRLRMIQVFGRLVKSFLAFGAKNFATSATPE